MFKRELTKPDGRRLILYSRRPIPDGIAAVSPSDTPVAANPHMRWHPLRGEWITYAAHRQDRTFLPPPEYNPLAPTRDPSAPTELPGGDYDVAVFQNRFPSLTLDAHDAPPSIVPTAPGTGACEVVVFTQDARASFGSLPVSHVELVLRVWADRTRDLGASPDIQYVMPFENRGVEMGVTLYHPHGQIYAYNHVPPVPARELEQQRTHFETTGRGLLEDVMRAEVLDGRRVIFESDRVLAWVPAFARYTYEVWIAPRRAAARLTDLDDAEFHDLAVAFKTVMLKYDHLFEKRPVFPYLMVTHQAPTDGLEHREAHLHFEFYPPYRTPDKLKYLAGTELGAGMFASDVLPEAKAEELRAVPVTVSD